MFFPYIGSPIIPADELIFFRGVAQPPTGSRGTVSKILTAFIGTEVKGLLFDLDRLGILRLFL